MTSEWANPIVETQKEGEKTGVLFKFLLCFLLLLLNVETISYLLLRDDAVIAFYQKALSSMVVVGSCFLFLTWTKKDRLCFGFFMLLLAKLVIESLVGFSSPLIYPSVLAVIFPFLYVYFIKNLFRHLNVDVLNVLMATIIIGYVLFMLFFGGDFDFSNAPVPEQEGGPFSGDTRILHANSIFLLVLPFLYCLNKMFSSRRTYLSIAGLCFSLIVILVHQHRTVWVAAILSSSILMYLNGGNKKTLRKLLLLVLVIAGVFTILLFTIPGLSQLLAERFVDVLDPLNEDNTGGFRYLQILAYLNYFIQKPLFGWTFAGFELPNPFLADNWEEGSGHHFHDAYIEVLFYFGITGLLLKFFPLYTIARRIKRRLSDQSKVLAAFCISGFLYSFSYSLPLIFWGIVGLCLYYIERDFRINSYNQVSIGNG